jgi:hypothetical protein
VELYFHPQYVFKWLVGAKNWGQGPILTISPSISIGTVHTNNLTN